MSFWWEFPGDSEAGNGAGAAYLFFRDQGGPAVWGEARKLTASDIETGDLFGYSVAINGDTALVGAHWEGSAGATAGAAYLFERNHPAADQWGEVQKLTASDSDPEDEFGWSVSLAGDVAIVGAHGAEESGHTDSGVAYIFTRSGGTWSEQERFIGGAWGPGARFGHAVAIDGDAIVVGAPYHDLNTLTDAGAAYVYQPIPGYPDDWALLKKLTASDAAADDTFGYSVAVSGDTIVVGASGASCAGPSCGAAYVFEQDHPSPNDWGQVKKLQDSDPETSDFFGKSVAIDGDTIVVGAPRERSTGNYAGAIYVFRRDEGGTDNWGLTQKLVASDAQADDEFGRSVAIHGDTTIVGAPREDSGGIDSGAAYLVAGLEEDGVACSRGEECISGHCVDGVCCNDSCGDGSGGDCQACSQAQGASVDGTCGPVTVDTVCRPAVSGDSCDPEESCDGVALTCPADVIAPDGTPCPGGSCEDGSCVSELSDGQPCTSADECASGFCTDAICCAEQDCSPFVCGPGGVCRADCESLADCQPGYACSADGRCVDGAAQSADDAGCSCRAAGGPRKPGPWLLLGMLAWALGRRRWRRSKRLMAW